MTTSRYAQALTRRLIRKALAESYLRTSESLGETLEPTEAVAVRDFWQKPLQGERLAALVNAERGMVA